MNVSSHSVVTAIFVAIAALAASAAPAVKQPPPFASWDFSQAKSLPYQTSDQTLFENVRIDGKPNVVVMQASSRGLVPIQRSAINTVTIPFGTITVDGVRSDWRHIAPVVQDPAADKKSEYGQWLGTDLANVYLARDDEYLYFLMTLHDGQPVTVPQTLYVVEFQQYLHQIHTPGDLAAYVSYTENHGWTVFVGSRGPGGAVALYLSDHVGIGLGAIEWKVPIASMQFPANTPYPYASVTPPPPGIENQFLRAYIHPGPHPEPPPISDLNDALSRPMIVGFYDGTAP